MTVAACLWLGLFPLLQGGTYARITYDKRTFMLILTAVTFLLFLLDRSVPKSETTGTDHFVSSGAKKASLAVPAALAAALLLWTVLSCLFSASDRAVWWTGEAARYEGLYAQLCYFVLFFCFLFSRVSLKPVLLSAAAGVILFFIVVMDQRAGGNPLGLYPGGRSFALNPEFQGTIGNVDMGTGYLVLLAGLFLCSLPDQLGSLRNAKASSLSSRSFPRPNRRCPLLLPVFLSCALLIALYLIITMDVQFGLISVSVLLIYMLLRFLPRRARLPVLILLIIAVLLAVWFWPGYTGGLWELHEIVHGRGRLSFGSNRAAVWLYSLRLGAEAPFLGGGSGTFRSRFNRFLSENGLTIPKEQDGVILPDYFDTPHNEYIAQLTDHGLPAMLLFTVLLFASLLRRRRGWFPWLSPCSAAVLCYAVQAFFSFSVCIVAPMFWVLLGLSFRE